MGNGKGEGRVHFLSAGIISGKLRVFACIGYQQSLCITIDTTHQLFSYSDHVLSDAPVFLTLPDPLTDLAYKQLPISLLHIEDWGQRVCLFARRSALTAAAVINGVAASLHALAADEAGAPVLRSVSATSTSKSKNMHVRWCYCSVVGSGQGHVQVNYIARESETDVSSGYYSWVKMEGRVETACIDIGHVRRMPPPRMLRRGCRAWAWASTSP